MEVYRKDSGKQFVPPGHAGITARVIFNPEGGSLKTSVLVSSLSKSGGMDEEVHEGSDQIFYVLQGRVGAFSQGRAVATLVEGDAILVVAGDFHSFSNEGEGDCKLLVITVPPVGQIR